MKQRRCHSFLGLMALLTAVALGLGGAPVQAELRGHGGFVRDVTLSPDGRFVLTASFDYTVIYWDLERQEALAVLDEHDAAVNAVAFLSSDRALSASDDGTLRLWDLRAERSEKVLQGHEGRVPALAVSRDGRYAASGGWDQMVRIWDMETGEILQLLEGHENNVNVVAFSPDGKQLLSGGYDGRLILWDVESGARLNLFSRSGFPINALAFTPDATRALTAGVDETVRLWDLEAGEELATLGRHDGAVFALAVHPDGLTAASAGLDRQVRLWDLRLLEEQEPLAGHLGPVWALEFSPDGRQLLSAGGDDVARVWDLQTRQEIGVSLEERERPPLELSGDPLLQRGAKVYQTCAVCHSLTPGSDRRAGPSLHGIFGRKAGTLEDYNYSDALEESDIVWDGETIAELFRKGPHIVTPGSKMPIQRVGDAEDLKALVAYLEAVTKPDAARQRGAGSAN